MRRPTSWRGVGDAVVGWLGALLLRALGASWRARIEGDDPGGDGARGPRLAALWHRDALIAAALFRDRGCTAAVSLSRDGDRIAAALDHLGYRPPPRGSSSRGGVAAARGVSRRLRDGVTTAIVTDGPRGPARRSKPGVAALARLTGVSITPVAFAARPCLRFGSWDRMRLPLPFARVHCRLAPPIPVAPDARPGGDADVARALDRTLAAMSDALEARIAPRRPPRGPPSAG
jgi:lysophospholipid acyltransferase (LPLAT)-like uncharacterized protein